MEKTKEEILTPYAYTEQWGFIDVVSLGNAQKAMQEYADQEKGKEALGFAEWIRISNIEYHSLFKMYIYKQMRYTDEQLYQIYKKEQHRK